MMQGQAGRMPSIGGVGMEVFADFLDGIEDPKSRMRTEEVLD